MFFLKKSPFYVLPLVAYPSLQGWQGKSGSDLKLTLVSSCVLSCTLVFLSRKMNRALILVRAHYEIFDLVWRGPQKPLDNSFAYCWLFWFLKVDSLAGDDRHATLHGGGCVVCRWSGSKIRLGGWRWGPVQSLAGASLLGGFVPVQLPGTSTIDRVGDLGLLHTLLHSLHD